MKTTLIALLFICQSAFSQKMLNIDAYLLIDGKQVNQEFTVNIIDDQGNVDIFQSLDGFDIDLRYGHTYWIKVHSMGCQTKIIHIDSSKLLDGKKNKVLIEVDLVRSISVKEKFAGGICFDNTIGSFACYFAKKQEIVTVKF